MIRRSTFQRGCGTGGLDRGTALDQRNRLQRAARHRTAANHFEFGATRVKTTSTRAVSARSNGQDRPRHSPACGGTSKKFSDARRLQIPGTHIVVRFQRPCAPRRGAMLSATIRGAPLRSLPISGSRGNRAPGRTSCRGIPPRTFVRFFRCFVRTSHECRHIAWPCTGRYRRRAGPACDSVQTAQPCLSLAKSSTRRAMHGEERAELDNIKNNGGLRAWASSPTSPFIDIAVIM
jgi:hypothetical protein